MRLTSPRVLAASVVAGGLCGAAAGAVFALAAGRVLVYGVGAGLFVAGLVVLAVGLLGAVEPPTGWATGPGAGSGRRGLLARLVEDSGDARPGSLQLAAWGAIVGGGLIATSMVAFRLAAP